MPIRAVERARYPKDWPAISRRVREEAGQCCEWCRAPNATLICRGEGADAGTYMMEDGEVRDAKTGATLGVRRGSEYDGRFVAVVLTVAHLDHQPENVARENLRALCQRCHLTYDAPHHARNAAETKRRRKAAGDLFGSAP